MAKILIGKKRVSLPPDSKAALALADIKVQKRAKCSCGRAAVYVRKQEGRYYCSDCFVRQFERHFKRTVRKYGLLKKGEHVAVALSGGKDSTVLLYLLSDLAKSMQLKVTAITVDEGIKNYKSDTLKSAKALCRKLRVPLKTVSFKKEFGFGLDDIGKRLDGQIQWCSWCGVLRRRALNSAARKLGCTKLAVSHNLDDEVQSIMLGLLRGDMGQFQRLGFAPGVARSDRWVPRIKPLRDTPETESTLYAILKGIPFSPKRCPHSREIMRHKLRVFMNSLESDHPGTKHQVLRFYDKLQPSIARNNSAEVVLCGTCGEPSSSSECRVCGLLKQLKGAV